MKPYEFQNGETIEEQADGGWNTSWEEDGRNEYDTLECVLEGLADHERVEIEEAING